MAAWCFSGLLVQSHGISCIKNNHDVIICRYIFTHINIYIYIHIYTYIDKNTASLTSNASRHCNDENLECFFENLWRGHVQYWLLFPNKDTIIHT